MARFTDEWLTRLLDKNDIIEVISGYLPLQKRGANYWAKCPWHPETRPSFSVTPSKQMFYCFSCRKGGSAINFVMEYEKLSYQDAVLKLADRVGMEAPEAEHDPDFKKKEELKKRLYSLMADTARYFHNNLKREEGKAGLDYLVNRGISAQITKFGLGYALNTFDDLKLHLKKLGYTEREMLEAGVVKKKNDHYYDTFRDRVMFPIIDIRGNVIAFGGRIIAEGEPKYLNSPETLIFNKRRNLYNLCNVKKKADLKSIVLAEGYMDVVSLAAAGVDVAVASLGTALSEEQARLIKRYVNRVYLSYDGDTPGIKAALRGADILTKAGLNVFVIRLPEGMDPDELIKKYGVKKYYDYVRAAAPAFEFKLDELKKDYNLNNKEELLEYAKAASRLIKTLPEGIEQDRYTKYLAKVTQISEATLTREVSSKQEQAEAVSPIEVHKSGGQKDPEARLISLVIQYPQILEQTDIIKAEIFGNELYKSIINFVENKIKKGFSTNCAEILSVFSQEGLQAGIVTDYTFMEDEYKPDIIKECLKAISKKRCTARKEELLKELESAEGSRRIALMQELNSINKQIQTIRSENI